MTQDTRLAAIIIEVSDLDRSATLYREGFGVDLHASDHESDDRWMGGSHASLSWGATSRYRDYDGNVVGLTQRG